MVIRPCRIYVGGCWLRVSGGDFSVGTINIRYVFIKFALEEDYTKLWIKSIWFVDGFPMRVFKWTSAFNPKEESPIVPTKVGLGFGTEMFIQPVLYERLPKYCGTCGHLGHGEEECYEKRKTKPVWPIDGQGASAPAPVPAPDPAPACADLRVKLHAQRARRDLSNHRRGKRVVFEVSEARALLEASASGSKRDGEEMHDCDAPEIVMTEVRQMTGKVDDVKEGPNDGLHSTLGDDHQEVEKSSDIVQATAVAREELPGCVQNTLAHDFSHLATEAEDEFIAPTGDSVVQTDEDEVVRRVACHRRGRSMSDGSGSARHSASPDWGLFWNVRGIGNDPTLRVLNRVRKQNHLDFLAIMEPMVPLDGRFMARRLEFQDVISNYVNQIWFFRGLDVRCQVLLDHKQLLHLRLESNRWPKPIFVTSVYARRDIVERRDLWDVRRMVSVGASSWIVGGDFNTVLSLEERSGGAAPSSVAMSDFHDVITDCALVDAGYTGSPYT
ncbi:UNVERIFIED_CONTAM: hypothetical protein Slati_1448300 [Sesamum latifolium]|uniref:DUF4283 domain-containing protein n=1 Tax=Sesamum latifolium TaxID=2727402 RepID=A0AAW2X6S1_9LAMI